MTVLEAIQKGREYLEGKGVESARLESEWLIGHVLRMERLHLYLNFERALSESESDQLRILLKRRGAREPLQHILGSACFCGLEMEVNREVLIPRPETELLAERGWKFLESCEVPATFLDFGTGSGCIAIALCHFAKEARGTALDRSTAALEMARRNADGNRVSDRLTFVESDGFRALDPSLRFDLIISNPPYIPTSEIETLQPEVRDYDPRAALDGGADGLDFYRMLASQGAGFLRPAGKVMVELGDRQAETVSEVFQMEGWEVEAVEKDLTGRPRMLIARRAGNE